MATITNFLYISSNEGRSAEEFTIDIDTMASATGIPQEHPDTIESRAHEPLLGGPGAATQKEDASILYNLFTGE